MAAYYFPPGSTTRFMHVFVLLLLSFVVSGQEEETRYYEENDACLKCHGHHKYYYYNDWIEKDVKERMNPYFVIDSGEYYNSNHRSFKCIDCHSYEYETFPHSGELRMELKYTCMDCHEGDDNFEDYHFERINEEYEQSVHSRMHHEDFTCWMCHNPHSYHISARTNIPRKDVITYDNIICLSCHADIDKYQLMTDRENPNILETHNWLPNQRLHFRNVRCIECHAELQNDMLVAHNIQNKENAVRLCVECHSQNSILMASLYKFQSQEKRNKLGFFNATILTESYVIGANRNYFLNLSSLVIFGLVLMGVLLHFILRVKTKNSLIEMEKVYLYPIWVRIWHMINVILCLILIISGLSMQYSSPHYSIMEFNLAVTMHNVSGIILSVSYLLFVFGNIFSSNGKCYKMKIKGGFKRLSKQFRFYTIGIFKGKNPPYEINSKRKFNPMQKLSYILIMYLIMPFLFLTGWALIFPDLIFINRIFGTSGIHFTDLVHIIAGFILSVFMVIHIYFCTISKVTGASFRAMITGWH